MTVASAGRDPLAGWLERRRRRSARRVGIADALIAGQWGAYVRYRLRWFSLRFVIGAVLHGINLAILVRVFSANLGAVSGTYAVVGLARAAWWGVLEGLRSRIRSLFREGRSHRADDEIAAWLKLSLRVAAMAGVIVVVAIVALVSVSGMSPVTAFVATALVITVVDVPVRCYHSGLSAVRRIYRPLPVLLLLDLSSLLVLGALWPLIGSWAVPVAQLVAGVAMAAATLRYTRRLYWFIGLDPVRRLRQRRTRAARPGRSDLLAGASSAAMSIDATLLAILSIGADRVDALAAVIVVILPGLRAGVDWANLFYFDLARLGVGAFRRYRAFVADRLQWLSVVIGLAASVVGVAAAAVAVPDVGATILLALVPLFLARSALAVTEVAAFTNGAHQRLIGASAIVLIGSVPAAFVGDARVLLLALTVASVAGYLVLRQAEWTAVAPRPGTVRPLADWLDEVVRRNVPQVLVVATVSTRHDRFDPGSTTFAATKDLAVRLAAELADVPSAGVAVAGASTVVVAVESGDPVDALLPERVHGLAAGLLDGQERRTVASGLEVVRCLRERLGLRERVPAARRPGEDVPSTPAEVVSALDERFRLLVRSGVRGGPDRPVPDLNEDERGRVLAAAVHHATYGLVRGEGRYEITSICVEGEITGFHAVSRRAPERVRAEWRAVATDALFAVALAGPMTADADGRRLVVPDS